ncbi:MAG: hypothetical protein ACLQBU_14395 [Terriglobales bacterium]
MDDTVKTEIGEIALGFDLKYKISNMRMATYLAPAYVQLKGRHSELRFEEFINEVIKIREQGRKKAGAEVAHEADDPGLAALLEEWTKTYGPK